MPSPEELTYYSTQSLVTDPGTSAPVLAGLPANVVGLHKAAVGLVIHYVAERPVDQGVAPERMAEIETRYSADMLARIAELDDSPLDVTRPPTSRLVGCCRDFTVLFVTMARAAGIPARLRVGFAGYLIPGYYVDHTVAEVWDDDAVCWVLIDPEFAEPLVAADGTVTDPLDVGRDRFLVGGAAWHQCRTGQADPDAFVVHPALEDPLTRSWPFMRRNLVADLAALNKVETLQWDAWGLIGNDPSSPEELELLDRVASLTTVVHPDFQQVRAIYENEPELRVPPTITSYDPLGGPPRRVTLRTVVEP
jgi:hypothetical protein